MGGQGKGSGGTCALAFTLIFLGGAVACGIAALITSSWMTAKLDGKTITLGLWESCPTIDTWFSQNVTLAEPEPEPENATTPKPEPEPETIPEPFDGSCEVFVTSRFGDLQPWMITCIVIVTVGVAFTVLAFFTAVGVMCLKTNKYLHVFLMIVALFAGMLLFIAVALYGANANPTTGTHAWAVSKRASAANFGYSYFVMIAACFLSIMGGICTQLLIQARFD